MIITRTSIILIHFLCYVFKCVLHGETSSGAEITGSRDGLKLLCGRGLALHLFRYCVFMLWMSIYLKAFSHLLHQLKTMVGRMTQRFFLSPHHHHHHHHSQVVSASRLVGADHPLEMVYFVESPGGQRMPAAHTANLLNGLDVQRAAIVLGYRVQGILAQREYRLHIR